MILDFAPMEGITGRIFRNEHAKMFAGADYYWAPFIAPDTTGQFKLSKMQDILPENNEGIKLIPQVLANNADVFLLLVNEFAAMGYKEVNLNAGCPSGTVVAKHKGAGMLSDLKSLDEFLDKVFDKAKVNISVKTRLGISDPEEFEAIMAVYKKYPIYKLTVHLRTRAGMYKSPVNVEAFAPALEAFGERAVYNGNVFSPKDLDRVLAEYPKLEEVMLGRGAVANPALFREIRGAPPLSPIELKEFHDIILLRTLESGLSEKYTVAHMKELWQYFRFMFEGVEKQYKAINKVKTLADYKSAVQAMFASGCFNPNRKFGE